MANYSDLTRKEQVLEYLAERANTWVDGPDIANEAVGGSEGHKRARELRAEGHKILVRAHPDPNRDIYQYKLVLPEKTPEEKASPPVSPGLAGRRMPMYYDRKTGRYAIVANRCPDCGGQYTDAAAHNDEPQHQRWLAKRDQIEHGQQRIPVEPEPPSYRYTTKPDRIVVGETAFCPRCKGYRRKERRNRDGEIVPADTFCVDPVRRMRNGELNPCERCGGHGIVPIGQL